jgi:hypothetical protein
MRTRTDLALACVLALSLMLNAYLILRKPVPRGRLVNADSSRAAAHAPRPAGLVPSDIDPALPCEQQLAEVEARIAALQPELDKNLTPKERFEAAATSDRAAESELDSLLDKMSADAPDDFGYEVECRPPVCRITVQFGSTPYPLLERIQKNLEFRSLWQSMMFVPREAYLVKRDPN